MSISLESPLMLLPSHHQCQRQDLQSVSQCCTCHAGPIPKPQPRPRPRQKGTATEHSCAGEVSVTVEGSRLNYCNSCIDLCSRRDASCFFPRKVASKNIETAETNHTSKGIGLEQLLPGCSADLPRRAGSLKGESKRKAMGKPEAAGSFEENATNSLRSQRFDD
jgi:hypothetical protein